jgi:small-conductance mechanosensitive channel
MRRFLIFLLLCLCARPGWATPPAPNPHGITPIEAAQIGTILADPQKRAAVNAALAAVPPSTSKPAAGTAAPVIAAAIAAASAQAAPAPGAVPLAPDSVGAQLINQVSAWSTALLAEADAALHWLAAFGGVVVFVEASLADPAKRALLIKSFGSGLTGLLIAAGVDAGLRYGLRRPLAWAVTRCPGRPARNIAWGPRLRSHLLRFLINLGLVLPKLAVLAVGVSLGLLLPPLFLPQAVASGSEMLTLAYAASRVVLIASGFLLSPEAEKPRLLALSTHAARATSRFLCQLVFSASFGFATIEMARRCGMAGAAASVLINVLLFAVTLQLAFAAYRARLPVARLIGKNQDPATWRGRIWSRLAGNWHVIAIFGLGAAWFVRVSARHDGISHAGIGVAGTLACLILAEIFTRALTAGLDRGLSTAASIGAFGFDLEARLRRWQWLLRGIMTAAIGVLALTVIAAIWGFDVGAAFAARGLGGRLLVAGGMIALYALAAILIYEGLNGTLEKRIATHMRDGDTAGAARLRTFLPILRSVLAILLGVSFAIITLQEIGIDTGPILAGAGIAGVALGLGSQKLVQDFVTGIFLLAENAMQVGDYVTVAGFSGTVEALSIRTVRLRAGDGSVHLIPFSAVSTVTNVNRGLGNAALSVSVPIGTDIDQVFTIWRDIAAELRSDDNFADMIRGELSIYGVDRLEAGIMTITGQIPCSDTGRLPVLREFNRRLAPRMTEARIPISAPVQPVLNLPA